MARLAFSFSHTFLPMHSILSNRTITFYPSFAKADAVADTMRADDEDSHYHIIEADNGFYIAIHDEDDVFMLTI